MSQIKEIVKSIMDKNFSFDTDVAVLVITDRSTEKLGTDFYRTLNELGWKTELKVMIDRKKSGEEPDGEIASAMTKYPLVFCLTKHSLTHTVARREANQHGVSVITMPGITEDMFLNGAINADYSIVETATLEMTTKLSNHEKVMIKTGDDLELVIPIGNREGIPSTGVFEKQGDSGNLPSGEAYIAPIEYKAEGKIEINGSIAGIGLVNTPVVLEIQSGRLISATGKQGEQLLSILGPDDGRILAELGIGTNYAARITGNILEDEKAHDTIHVAFGSNHTFGGVVKTNVHIDCVTKSPEIYWTK
ncbi:leucyl aminopeptidase (aminopeptidase T) [Virgibacillus halotolerans]|uniref:aminopeptidase n=1 Tax=Virgibacillus halotolerans TaxID=1071053 RepID=UPI0019612EBF|nr:aminopeptidase [Virgibacillus halotolerans]MBM7599122.1 leucyl aminopeptidase (aminopeptidase T) [Virgibacillus halotolerans]